MKLLRVNPLIRLLTVLLVLGQSVLADWRVSLPGWKYEFPRDHGNHPDFKTEWWYFTGNLTAKDGREFGYQLTFFRQGLGGAGEYIPLSRFVTRDLKFAHFTVSDLQGGQFRFFEKLSRGAFDEAGFDRGQRLAWIEEWTCELTPDGGFLIRAEKGDVALQLALRLAKPPIIHGRDGVSQKAEGEGRASHYYSLTRLLSSGTIRLSGEEFAVEGTSWFDHEWATNQLAADQVGWDWFSLQFDDQTELMLFQLRRKEGGRDRHSGGTFIDAEGKTVEVTNDDFTLDPIRWWDSPNSQGRYPVEWKLSIPKLNFSATVRAAMDAQELSFPSLSYWEGSVRAAGTRDGRPVQAKGYLEMTGYAGALVGMQAGEP